MPSGRQKPLTCHLWDVPEHPQIHGMAKDGVKGLSCCTDAILNLGKAFSPAAKHRQETLPQFHHLPGHQQDISCFAPGHSYTSYLNVQQDVFNGFKKSLAKKRVIWMKRS